jgi:hypothetical protein
MSASDLPSRESQGPRPIIARCFGDWPQFEPVLRRMLHAAGSLCGPVSFSLDDNSTPDWHVFFNHPGARPVEIFAPPNRVLFAIAEPPLVVFRQLHLGQGPGTFVMTCDERLSTRRNPARRYILAPCMTPSWSVARTLDWLRVPREVAKPGLLSWVTSDDAFLPGQRNRLAFLEKLRAEVTFDLFGRGFNPIEDKWDALAPYRYSIAFENTLADYYFTEKIMDCFVAETLPLYVGSAMIGNFFPAEAVEVIDPHDPDVFRKIRELIVSDAWIRRRPALREAKQATLERYNVMVRVANFICRVSEPPEAPVEMRIDPVNWLFQARPGRRP